MTRWRIVMLLQFTILFLILPAASAEEAVDTLSAKCDALAQAGQFAEARAVAEQILARGDGYAIRLQLGWLNLKCGDLAAAETNYRRAAAMNAEAADPWLGLQLVALQRQDWRAAQAAGEKALAVDPASYWATGRQAFAVYMQGRYEQAETLYRRALQLRPAEPEMLLGLGFTRIRRGAVEEGRALCEQAGTKLGADSRVAECLALSPAPQVTGGVSASASYLRYTHPWDVADSETVTATGSATWPVGVTAWAGASFSRSILRYEADNFWQVAPIADVDYRTGPWWVGAAGAWVISNTSAVNTAKIAVLHGGYDGAPAGGAVAVAASLYPSYAVFQVDPDAVFHIGRRALISFGPEVISVGAHQHDGPAPGPTPTETLVSGHFYARCQVVGPLALYGSGFFGRRRFPIDAGGLSIWSADDLFAGGYGVGVAVEAGAHVGITLDFDQSFGIQQSYLRHDFSLLGGMLAMQTNF